MQYVLIPIFAILAAGAVFGYLACFNAWLEGTKDTDDQIQRHDYHTGPFHLLYHLGQNHEAKRNARLDARDAKRAALIQARGGKL